MAAFSGSLFGDLFALTITILLIIYFSFRYRYGYWKRRRFPCPLEPSIPFGNFAGVSRTIHLDQALAKIYAETKGEAFVGCFLLLKPMIIVRDLELAKNILIKDFSHFHDRLTIRVDLKKDPLGGHLFLLGGQEWRNLRIKLTPTFTSGKMKFMFPTLIQVGNDLITVLEKSPEDVEMKDILARYTTDVISSVAFGLDTSSLKNPDAEFRKYGLKFAKPGIIQRIMILLFFAAPKLATTLPIAFVPKDINDFFVGAVKDTADYRTNNNIQRNDFFQLLLQLKNLGYVKDADNPDKKIEDQQKFSLEDMASQAFLFFFAGFETSSATMACALYELALNPELQKRTQENIQEKLEKYGDFTYEALMEMDLLDRVVSETLRKYPVAGSLLRQCNNEYPIPNTSSKILPGETVMISIYGIHHDPDYYPDPEKFDPDRFLPENKAARPHMAYIPFGEGPRNCIGNRFGLMQTKAGLAMILDKFDLSPTKKTPIPIEFDPKSNILTPKGDISMKLTKRKF